MGSELWVVRCQIKDIDSDVESDRRSDVEKYMSDRFGYDNVCSVSTYTTLQIKAALKDFGRVYGKNYAETNLVTAIIESKTIEELVTQAVKEKYDDTNPKTLIYDFITEDPLFFMDVMKVVGLPKVGSVHACAKMIFPQDKKMWEWTPMVMREGIPLTEFEGSELDACGFLKYDLLGLDQLDKFRSIKKLSNEDFDLDNIPLDDPKVYKYFCNGWNSDVFQYGSTGFSEFCKELKPHNINDLIAGVALYRPGAMENGFHTIYNQCKNEGRKPEYLWGSEDITKDTYGVFVYQESIARACVEIGGFSLVEADDVRRAMGKKKMSVLLPYEERFKSGAMANGCPKDKADELWDMMLEFTKYSFNLSHSASYGITAYRSQWLKVHRPAEFWTTAIQRVKPNKRDKVLPLYIAEIVASGSIDISSPDINKSDTVMSIVDGVLYWGLGSIKGIGDAAVEQLNESRKYDFEYKSFQNFLDRHVKQGSKVNKTVIERLIICGAFDELESISKPIGRIDLLEAYWERMGKKIKQEQKDKYYVDEAKYNWWWLKMQKEYSGYALFDYKILTNHYLDADVGYESPSKFNGERECMTGGYVLEYVQTKTKKKGESMAIIKVENNFHLFTVLVWHDSFVKFEDKLKDCKGKLLLLSGTQGVNDKTKEYDFRCNKDTVIEVL